MQAVKARSTCFSDPMPELGQSRYFDTAKKLREWFRVLGFGFWVLGLEMFWRADFKEALRTELVGEAWQVRIVGGMSIQRARAQERARERERESGSE